MPPSAAELAELYREAEEYDAHNGFLDMNDSVLGKSQVVDAPRLTDQLINIWRQTGVPPTSDSFKAVLTYWPGAPSEGRTVMGEAGIEQLAKNLIDGKAPSAFDLYDILFGTPGEYTQN